MALLSGTRAAAWVVLLGATLPARAQSPAAEEYQVKAAFVFNFAKFVEWPAAAFESPKSPLLICVFRQSPIGNPLSEAVRGKTIENRPLAMREISAASEASACHIPFLGASQRQRTRALLEDLSGRSILTVGESDDFLASGGIVNFKLIGGRVRFEINAAAAVRVKLRISSKLLSLGEPHEK